MNFISPSSCRSPGDKLENFQNKYQVIRVFEVCHHYFRLIFYVTIQYEITHPLKHI